jgi:hypothetical protein
MTMRVTTLLKIKGISKTSVDEIQKLLVSRWLTLTKTNETCLICWEPTKIKHKGKYLCGNHLEALDWFE